MNEDIANTKSDSHAPALKSKDKTVEKHWESINQHMVIRFSLLHLFAIEGLRRIPMCSPSTLLWAFVLSFVSMIGITVGAHRLWSHRSFEASLIVRIILMLFNSIANQGTIFHWSRDHRVHHKYSETDADPHNAKRGFFYAHMGWLLLKKHTKVVEAGSKLDLSDLYEDPVVMFQKKSSPYFAIFMCFIMPVQVAVMCWGENAWNAFFVAGGMRYCVNLHFTFLVNSAAHIYGDHPYDPKSLPAENPIVSMLTAGEGWHNWHHKYPFDYAASEYGVTSQYNPSKLFIDTFAFLGLIWGRKRATNIWEVSKMRRDTIDFER